MLSLRVLGASVVLALIPFHQIVAAQPFDSCGRIFTCDVGNGGDGVDITGGGWEPMPAEPSDPAPGPDHADDDQQPQTGPSIPPCTVEGFRDTTCLVVVLPDYPDTIYNTDLVRFTPHSPRAAAENDGMTLVTSPAAVSVSAAAHSMEGTLLGYPVTVTFTPVEVGIDFGDGSSASHPGTSGVFEHLYAARGVYSTTLTAEYTATVTFSDATPRPVIGTITAASPGPGLRVLAARTALIHETCITTPSAPGC